MIEAFRISETNSSAWPTRATGDPELAEALDALIERTKPPPPLEGWDPLIAAPFRYTLPVAQTHEARFRPPFSGRNVLYCSKGPETAAYEAAFHFMKQRRHIPGLMATEERILFSLTIVAKSVLDIRRRPDIKAIMSRTDYSASHSFIAKHDTVTVVLYPSCRDPKRRENFAVRDLESLGKKVKDQQNLTLFFDQAKDFLYIREMSQTVGWADVA